MKDNETLAREYADGFIASGGILREARYEAYLKGANDALRWRTWPQQGRRRLPNDPMCGDFQRWRLDILLQE